MLCNPINHERSSVMKPSKDPAKVKVSQFNKKVRQVSGKKGELNISYSLY